LNYFHYKAAWCIDTWVQQILNQYLIENVKLYEIYFKVI
jgi:hypothetical protein